MPLIALLFWIAYTWLMCIVDDSKAKAKSLTVPMIRNIR